MGNRLERLRGSGGRSKDKNSSSSKQCASGTMKGDNG